MPSFRQYNDGMIPRYLEKRLIERLKGSHEALILYGPRQVGKTTLVNQVLNVLPGRTLRLNADTAQVPEALSSRDMAKLRGLVQGYDVLFIDEAQRVPEIGLNIKLLVDHFPELRVVATGSSSLDLASKTRESLAGRAWNYTLYPIAALELSAQMTPFEMRNDLEARLIFGSYPRVVLMIGDDDERREYLDNLAAASLYKDILEMSGIRNSDKLRRLLRLLAFQIGQEVSLNELGMQLEMSKNTVASYIDLLEQSFVVFSLKWIQPQSTQGDQQTGQDLFLGLGCAQYPYQQFQFNRSAQRYWRIVGELCSGGTPQMVTLYPGDWHTVLLAHKKRLRDRLH